MGYLVAKMIVLLVLAAACGFWLGYRWVSRRHRDVTDEYTRLVDAATAGSAVTADGFKRIEERLGAIELSIRAPQLEGLESRLRAALAERAAALERTILSQAPRAADLVPVSERLEALESAVARIGVPDLDPIEARLAMLAGIADRLSSLERQVGSLAPKPPDFGPVNQRLEALAGAVGNRLASFEERLGSLAPQPPDLGPVTRRVEALATVVAERLGSLEERIGSPRPEPTLGPLVERLSAVERALAAVQAPDLGPIEARLSVLGAVQERLHAMSQSVEKLAPVAPDLGPVNRRLEALASAMGDRLSSLEHAIAALEPKPTDLGPIEARLASLTERIRALGSGAAAGAEGVDLGGLHERIDGLARQLDSLHAALERVVTQPAPAVVLPGSRNLLRRPVYGEPDDLKRIRGIGAGLEKILHRLGVYYFWQVAEWDRSDVRFVDSHLEIFKGRIERDRWVEQAESLAAEPASVHRPDSAEAPSGPEDA